MESVDETMRVESPPSIRYRSQYPVNVTSLLSTRVKSTTPRWPLDCITVNSYVLLGSALKGMLKMVATSWSDMLLSVLKVTTSPE